MSQEKQMSKQSHKYHKIPQPVLLAAKETLTWVNWEKKKWFHEEMHAAACMRNWLATKYTRINLSLCLFHWWTKRRKDSQLTARTFLWRKGITRPSQSTKLLTFSRRIMPTKPLHEKIKKVESVPHHERLSPTDVIWAKGNQRTWWVWTLLKVLIHIRIQSLVRKKIREWIRWR